MLLIQAPIPYNEHIRIVCLYREQQQQIRDHYKDQINAQNTHVFPVKDALHARDRGIHHIFILLISHYVWWTVFSPIN